MQVSCEREAFVPTHDFGRDQASPALIAGRAAIRALLTAWIEAAINCLDALDGDPDFEDGGDAEPSLGAIEVKLSLGDLSGWGAAVSGRAWDVGGLDQSNWGAGDRTDREDGDDNGIADRDGLDDQLRRMSDAPPSADADRLNHPAGASA